QPIGLFRSTGSHSGRGVGPPSSCTDSHELAASPVLQVIDEAELSLQVRRVRLPTYVGHAQRVSQPRAHRWLMLSRARTAREGASPRRGGRAPMRVAWYSSGEGASTWFPCSKSRSASSVWRHEGDDSQSGRKGARRGFLYVCHGGDRAYAQSRSVHRRRVVLDL